jgi:hypothetical protein
VTITRPDGLGSVHLNAFNTSSDVGPVWSPTRGELAFQAVPTHASSNSIYVVRADGRRKRRLAVGHNPRWATLGCPRTLAWSLGEHTLAQLGRATRAVHQLGRFVPDCGTNICGWEDTAPPGARCWSSVSTGTL